MLNLEVMTSLELDSLDRENTVFVMTMSPLEVHGPHLPLGTDMMVAEEIGDRAARKLKEHNPAIEFVKFPSYYMGSDTIPGSVNIDSRALFHLLVGTARFLKDRGFRYLLLLDNHGGPRHQIACAKAVRKSYKKYDVYIVAPFLSFYRKMVENERALLEKVNLGAGACGDIDDSHAGQNETSLMLRVKPEVVNERWKTLEREKINKRRWPALLLRPLSIATGALGMNEASTDIAYLGHLLCWVTDKNPSTYIGEPKSASPDAGERMLEAFAEEAVEGLLSAFSGKEPYYTPKGWTLRWLEFSH